MSFKGDFEKFRRLRAQLSNAMSDVNKARIAKVMGETARSELAKGFRNSVDPYGDAWAALKRRNGKPLLDTGRLRNSFVSNPSPTGFTLWSKVRYAKHHQYGTSGRSKASTRFQATAGSGRFMSRKKAAKAKRGFIAVRALNFQKGSGKIPARMMVPSQEKGFGNWKKPLEASAKRIISKILRGK